MALKTCPDCHGWPSCETGLICLTCDDEGVIWDEETDDDNERDEGKAKSGRLHVDRPPAAAEKTEPDA